MTKHLNLHLAHQQHWTEFDLELLHILGKSEQILKSFLHILCNVLTT